MLLNKIFTKNEYLTPLQPESRTMTPHLRHEKNCLNCGSTVEDRYCSHCGQENIVTKESFGHLFRHFFEDVTHYDSKFFITIKDLLLKPGFLTKEYLAGKRASYLHPIRMYVFISFLYFLAAYTIGHSGHKLETAIAKKASYDAQKSIADTLEKMPVYREVITRLKLDTLKEEEINFQLLGSIHYADMKEYVNKQQLLPEEKRAKGLKPWLYSHWVHTIDHYGDEAAMDMTIEKTQHAIPKLMFLLLPLFAFMLKLFYNKKEYYYGDHAIFSLHFHAAAFLLFLIVVIIDKCFPALAVYLSTPEMIGVFIYLIIAMKNMYRQSWLLSILKGLGLSLIYTFFIVAGFITIALTALL